MNFCSFSPRAYFVSREGDGAFWGMWGRAGPAGWETASRLPWLLDAVFLNRAGRGQLLFFSSLIFQVPWERRGRSIRGDGSFFNCFGWAFPRFWTGPARCIPLVFGGDARDGLKRIHDFNCTDIRLLVGKTREGIVFLFFYINKLFCAFWVDGRKRRESFCGLLIIKSN